MYLNPNHNLGSILHHPLVYLYLTSTISKLFNPISITETASTEEPMEAESAPEPVAESAPTPASTEAPTTEATEAPVAQ